MAKTIEERSKEAVLYQYNCEYPCGCYEDCVFGSGSNTSYDCEECGADEFQKGYIQGATDQHNSDMEKLKSVLNSLMVDTRDKAAIISLMEEQQ